MPSTAELQAMRRPSDPASVRIQTTVGARRCASGVCATRVLARRSQLHPHQRHTACKGCPKHAYTSTPIDTPDVLSSRLALSLMVLNAGSCGMCR